MTIYRQAGLAPPRIDELPPLLVAGTKNPPPSREPEQSRRSAASGGTLLRIKDPHFHRDPVSDLRARLVAYLQQHREIAPPAWKELVGQSRKFAIPLAEYFDAEKSPCAWVTCGGCAAPHGSSKVAAWHCLVTSAHLTDLMSYSVVAFSAIFVVDPIAVVPVFITITEGDSEEKRRQMARRACVITAAILLSFWSVVA